MKNGDGRGAISSREFWFLNVLAKLLGTPYQPDATDEGSVFKINMLLRRLPKLKATRVRGGRGFPGTFHNDEGLADEMNASDEQAKQGILATKCRPEVYATRSPTTVFFVSGISAPRDSSTP